MVYILACHLFNAKQLFGSVTTLYMASILYKILCYDILLDIREISSQPWQDIMVEDTVLMLR